MSDPCSPQNWLPRLADRMEGMKASEIRELLKLIERPDVISFAGGIPDPALFPTKEIENIYSRVLSDQSRAAKALQYSVSEGDADLRRWIVGYMADKNVSCTTDNILITNGSQQGLEFLGKMFLSPDDTVLAALPTYLGALQAFSAYQPNYASFDTNQTHQEITQQAAERAGAVKFTYVVPDFDNPTGETMSQSRRHTLLDQAYALDIPVIEDSPYYALRYDGLDEPCLQSLDIERCGSIDGSRVIHCGSFSKVFTPGLRVGWICAARGLIDKLTLIKQASDLNSPAINQMVIYELAQNGFDDQVQRARVSYRIKRDAMLAALVEHMPKGAQWSRPEGGLFVWLSLPEPFDAAKFLPIAVEKAGIAYVPGQAFHWNGQGANTLRLSFSLADVEDIHAGIKRFGEVLRAT